MDLTTLSPFVDEPSSSAILTTPFPTGITQIVNGSNGQNASTSSLPEDMVMSELLFYECAGISGTLLNILVLFIAIRHIDTDDKPRQILIMNMTFADLVFCLVYCVTRPMLLQFPVDSCHIYYTTIWTMQMCSCVYLLWLNVDKLLYIQFPLHYYSMVSRKKFLLLTIATWICLVGYAAIMNLTYSIGNSCVEVMFSDYKMYFVMCFFYLVVIVASFAISVVIYCIAQTTTRMEHRARTKLFQRLFFLFSSTMWTFITSVPFRALYLVNMFVGGYSNVTLRTLTDISFKLLVGGSVLNPVITIATQRIYRVRLIKYLGLFKEVVSKKSTSIYEDSSMIDKRRQSSKTTIILENTPLNPPSTAL
ncbi:unnamed protein product, partial [Mesorhabditis belari]|uniref:G-protein coupled receptors family 1 profile domain-containing protein n=1 Tax=Mesorhabditis belari TaxID=2138241 RepID=A0AAF3EHA3_9BILA